MEVIGRRGIVALCMVLACAASAHAGIRRIGSEFQVNTYTSGNQSSPAIGLSSSGGFVVVWQSFAQDGSNYGVFARRFDSGGAALDLSEFRVNSYTSLQQYGPSIGVAPSGDFVVSWTSYAQDGSGNGIFARRFDSAGAALDPADLQVNTYTTGEQKNSVTGVASTGDFVVSWVSRGEDGSGYGIFARRYDSSGIALDAADFQVNAYAQYRQIQPSISVDPVGGDFVVAWTSYYQDGYYQGAFARRFNSAGAPLDVSDIQLNAYTTQAQILPSVAAAPGGGFVVAWMSYAQDGSHLGVFGRRFDSSGVARDPADFQVNSYTTGAQTLPSVGVESTGDFVVAWQSDGQDGLGYGVFARRFDATGTPLDPIESVANTHTTGDQTQPRLAMAQNGTFVIVWNSLGQDGNKSGIFGQRFCSDADDDGVCNADDIVVTAPLTAAMVDCHAPADPLTAPTIQWAPGSYSKFHVYIGSSAAFGKGTFVTSGSAATKVTAYKPAVKQWTSACKKALAANPGSPALFIKVTGLNALVAKSDPLRKTSSQIVPVGVQP